MQSRSQASIEHSILVGFSIIVIISMSYIFYYHVLDMEKDVIHVQLENNCKTIINAAEEVWYGELIKRTITVYMPQGMTNVSFMHNSGSCTQCLEIRFVHKNSTVYCKTAANITGDINYTWWTPGEKKFVLQRRTNDILVELL